MARSEMNQRSAAATATVVEHNQWHLALATPMETTTQDIILSGAPVIRSSLEAAMAKLPPIYRLAQPVTSSASAFDECKMIQLSLKAETTLRTTAKAAIQQQQEYTCLSPLGTRNSKSPLLDVGKIKKKKPYKELTLEEKVQLIRLAETNGNLSQASIAERYSIAKSNVCRILQRRLEYLQAYESAGFAGNRKRKLRANGHGSAGREDYGGTSKRHDEKERNIHKVAQKSACTRFYNSPAPRIVEESLKVQNDNPTFHFPALAAEDIRKKSGGASTLVPSSQDTQTLCDRPLPDEWSGSIITTSRKGARGEKLLGDCAGAADAKQRRDKEAEVNTRNGEPEGVMLKVQDEKSPHHTCQYRGDSEGESSSPLSQHTSTSSHSTSHSELSPPRIIAPWPNSASSFSSSSSSLTAHAAKRPIVECEQCDLLKSELQRVAENSQARSNYLELYTVGLQTELLTISARLALNEQLLQKSEQQKNVLVMESGVNKLKLLACRDKCISMLKEQQQMLLQNTTSLDGGRLHRDTVLALLRLLSDNSEIITEITTGSSLI